MFLKIIFYSPRWCAFSFHAISGIKELQNSGNLPNPKLIHAQKSVQAK